MKLFINYKRNVDPDQSFARTLERALIAAGFDAFRDETGIASGTEWAHVIQRHLAESEVVISLVSNASLGSAWVLNEIDFARKHGKFIIPVLLESLDESIEFQEYIPRFRRTQHYTYRGDDAGAAADIVGRLRRSESLLDAQHFGTAAYRYDEEDDSENPAWRQFLEANPDVRRDGGVALGLDDAVRLAMLRSSYYQRNLRQAASGDEPPVDRAAFESYRQGFYTQVAIGDFGASAFAADAGRSPARRIGGYLGLLLSHLRAESMQHQLAALRTCEATAQALLDFGRGKLESLTAAQQATAAKELELLELRIEIEQRLEELKTYTLGLPEEVPLVIEDPMLKRFRLIDPALGEVRERALAFANELGELRSRATYGPPVTEEPERPPTLDKLQDWSDRSAAMLPDEFQDWCAEMGPDLLRYPVGPPLGEASSRRDCDPEPTDSTAVGALLSAEQLRRASEVLEATARELSPFFAATQGRLQADGRNDWDEMRSDFRTLCDDFDKEVAGLRLALGSLLQVPPIPGASERSYEEWRDLAELVELFRRGDAARQQVEESICDRFMGLLSFVELLQMIQARLAGEMLVPSLPALSQDRAERQAAECRPDREAFGTDVAFKRLVRQRLRRLLRGLDHCREQLLVAQRAWVSTLSQKRMASSRFFAGMVTIVEPNRAEVQLRDAEMNFVRLYLEFHADRLRLLRELGTLTIDDRGIWVGER